MLSITRIAVDDIADNCLTDNPNPVFSYMVASDRDNVIINDAIISVNGWSCHSLEQNGIYYSGKGFNPFSTYTLHIQLWDNTGEYTEASTTFFTGRMGQAWRGKWISDPLYHFTQKNASPKPMTFRKRFDVKKPIQHVTLYITALGIYEAELNGAKVGQDYFAPGYTSYHHQMQYQTYDVTAQTDRNNELIVVVAGGWAVGAYGYRRNNRLYAKRQALLCELRLIYMDGSEETFGTDESWDVTEEGRFREAEFYNGEVYDATVDYSTITWRSAALESLQFTPRLIAQYGVPVRAREILKPKQAVKSPSGMLIYDMGQNFAGVVRAKIRGAKGQRITFLHAEILMDGELYTKPLRSARQEAVYVCVEGEQFYSPRLTYMGFRYVGVVGIDESNLELEGVAVYSDVVPNGDFSCSNEMLNRMQSCIIWGARSNFVDIPTDCPQRDERLGWTGDIALFASTAVFNFDMSRFFAKWMLDLRTEQTRGGGIPMIVPRVNIWGQFQMSFPLAVDHWGDACILVPWAEYRARGNLQVLRDNYDCMKKYIKACRFWAGLFSRGEEKYIWKLLFHYGDWCAPDTNYKEWTRRGIWTATACLAHSSGILAEIAELLGREDDAVYFARLRDDTSRAYRNILMEQDCSVKGEFQTAYVLPLYYGLLNDTERELAAQNLVRLVRKSKYHIRTGFPGTPYILFALADNGYENDAYKMLLTDTCPSWLYEIKAGGTTFWERWDALREDGTVNQGDDGDIGMVSFNHYACGAVGDFLYRRIAGIEAEEGGYRSFRIAPLVGGDLTWAEGRVNTPYGEIVSSWKIENNIFYLHVNVPVNTSCTVIMPSGTEYEMGSGNWNYSEKWEKDI